MTGSVGNEDGWRFSPATEGRNGPLVSPLQGFPRRRACNPGRRCAAIAAPLCPGLVCGCPFGANAWHVASLKLLIWLHISVPILAQSNQVPHIGYVYPAGGCVATSFDVTVGGQYLQKIDQAHLSGEGVKVSVGKYYRPLTQGEFGALRQKLDDKREQLEAEQKAQGNLQPLKPEAIAKAAGVTEEQLKEMEIYRQREADPKRQPNVQIEEELTLRVEIDAGAPLGERELRLIDPTGMSNPLWFHVGQWPEARETEPNDKTPDQALREALPGVVNGRIFPGDIDRFVVRAKHGERLVIAASAASWSPIWQMQSPGGFRQYSR